LMFAAYLLYPTLRACHGLLYLTRHTAGTAAAPDTAHPPSSLYCRAEYGSECWTKQKVHNVEDDVVECTTGIEKKCEDVTPTGSQPTRCFSSTSYSWSFLLLVRMFSVLASSDVGFGAVAAAGPGADGKRCIDKIVMRRMTMMMREQKRIQWHGSQT